MYLYNLKKKMSAANTNFLNAQHRRIYQGTKGAYFVKRNDGKKVYSARATFRKVGANGVETKLNKANRNTVPSPLRRAVRKNAGVKRGPLKNGAVRKVPAARARKSSVASKAPLMLTMYSNANMRAAARAAKPRAVRKPTAIQSGLAVRKVRKNAGVKRGPPAARAAKPRAMAAMFGSPGGTVYKSKRSMAAKKRALSRVKAMNELLMAISPNPYATLGPKTRRRRVSKK